jgi:hypothetical protein
MVYLDVFQLVLCNLEQDVQNPPLNNQLELAKKRKRKKMRNPRRCYQQTIPVVLSNSITSACIR